MQELIAAHLTLHLTEIMHLTQLKEFRDSISRDLKQIAFLEVNNQPVPKELTHRAASGLEQIAMALRALSNDGAEKPTTPINENT